MRLDGWEKRLMELLQAAHDRPFEWGNHDCALFAAAGVLAITGNDVAADVRGHYSSAKGALKVLKTLGMADLESATTHLLGNPVDTRLAGRGDVVLVETANGPTLAICAGIYAFAPGEKGSIAMARHAWRNAWKVG
ncbi:DUF6950 family protein [Sedimenticola selenatireducens]|uniref:DUF6950 family protein n=1 Tax=Sedimenticola selenatireducens TaxID=191960 RepID=UPI0021B39308|nr:hypothetical protein [Sedimenticola selenatireducens]